MAIIKKAKNFYSQINKEYISISGSFTETAVSIIIDSMKENLSLNSNKKIIVQGDRPK